MSIHIAPLLLEHLETQPKDALAAALLKNCRLKGPVPLSFLLSVADRQQRWHPSKKAKEYLAAWRVSDPRLSLSCLSVGLICLSVSFIIVSGGMCRRCTLSTT